MKTYIYCNFNYCPLAWYFSSAASNKKKNESIKKGVLRFLHDNHYYCLLSLTLKGNKPTMEIK